MQDASAAVEWRIRCLAAAGYSVSAPDGMVDICGDSDGTVRQTSGSP